MKKIAIFFLIGFVFTALPNFDNYSFAQDAKQEEKKEKSEEEQRKAIANEFKDIVVDVETILTYEDGSRAGWGGSGFFIDGEGHLLTNSHVVRDDEEQPPPLFGPKPPKVTAYDYWITMQKSPANRRYQAKLIGWNKYVDVALLKVDGLEKEDFKVARLGDSDKVEVGEQVYAYGNPLGLTNTFTGGHVSALHRNFGNIGFELNFIEDFIQTTAPINPGNSGGPLINLKGEVVGITSARVPGADGLGFAIPLKLADVPRLKRGEVKLGYLCAGLMLDQFARTGKPGSPGFQDISWLNYKTGIEDLKSLELLANSTWERWTLVLKVDECKGAGDKPGLKRGDLVTHFNGSPVKSGRDVRMLMFDVEPGKEFEVKVLRVEKGAFKEMTIKLSLDKEKKK